MPSSVRSSLRMLRIETTRFLQKSDTQSPTFNAVYKSGNRLSKQPGAGTGKNSLSFEHGSMFRIVHYGCLTDFTQRKPTWLLAVRTSPLPRVPTM